MAATAAFREPSLTCKPSSTPSSRLARRRIRGSRPKSCGLHLKRLMGRWNMRKLLMGNQAFAHAALEAGVRVVAGYPGTPSSEVIETVAGCVASGSAQGVHVEWPQCGKRSAHELQLRGGEGRHCHLRRRRSGSHIFANRTGHQAVRFVREDPRLRSRGCGAGLRYDCGGLRAIRGPRMPRHRATYHARVPFVHLCRSGRNDPGRLSQRV